MRVTSIFFGINIFFWINRNKKFLQYVIIFIFGFILDPTRYNMTPAHLSYAIKVFHKGQSGATKLPICAGPEKGRTT